MQQSRVFLIEAPDAGVFGTQQKVIQHLVVGEQDVRRIFLHRSTVGDRTIRNFPAALGVWDNRHLFERIFFCSLIFGGSLGHTPGIHSNPDPRLALALVVIAQLVRGENFFSKTVSLIGGQGVHRVKHNRLDALALTSLLHTQAVIQKGIQKTLGFARASPCCDDRRFWHVAISSGQLLPTLGLMLERNPGHIEIKQMRSVCIFQPKGPL